LTGYTGILKVHSKREKRFDYLNQWNLALLAIGFNQSEVLQMLCDHVKGFHRLNILSKPYSLE